ncbi:hypothetical protein TNCV_4140741 [Trichonephila clavipes]|nr:hypothetical protein TNCV_4140741 [Trichonephila clavipes]
MPWEQVSLLAMEITHHNRLDESRLSGTVKKKVSQVSPRALTSAQDSYLALSAQQHKRTTAPQLSRDLASVSGRSLQSSCRDWPLRPASSPVHPFNCMQQKRLDFVKLKTFVVDTTIIGAYSFSNESKCTRQDDSRRVKAWRENASRFHPTLCNKNRHNILKNNLASRARLCLLSPVGTLKTGPRACPFLDDSIRNVGERDSRKPFFPTSSGSNTIHFWSPTYSNGVGPTFATALTNHIGVL